MAPRYMHLKAAKAYGLLPSQWDNLDEDDKAWILALDEVESKMQAYEEQQATKGVKP